MKKVRGVGVVLILASVVGIYFAPQAFAGGLLTFLLVLLIILLLVAAGVALLISSVAKRIFGMVQSVLHMAATESAKQPTKVAGNLPSAVIDVTDVSAKVESMPTLRSLRCKSCGAVNKVSTGQPEICMYCDSPLTE
jgi:hypothetical protein